MAVKTTPIEFMHQLMYHLSNTYQNDSNKLDLALADLTGIAGLTQITYWMQLRDMIKADIINNTADGGTAKDFLKNYCNIDLDNEDCGALIGYDCSGGKVLTSDTIIDEQGNLQSHPSTAVIRGCTISFPTFSDTTYNYVLDGLYTWWIGLPFDLVKKSFGLEFNANSFIADMSINLFDTPPSSGTVVGAYVATWYDSDEKVALMELCVNMNNVAYGSIIIGNKNGDTSSGIVAPLDRVLAHELTHALMATNIRYYRICFPSWFKEGVAELVGGCDDSRTADLLQAAGDINIIDDGFSNNPTLARNYSVGFLAMRYLLKQYTENQIPIYFPDITKEPFEKLWEKKAHGIRSEYCISRDGDLNKIVDEFIDFAQRDDYNLVQPWALCSNKGSKTLRIPLEGHENKVEDEICILNANTNSEEKIVNMSKVFNSALKVAKSGGFIIDSKKDTDFPCFYLSTGVFKPKDWDNQNLVYPSAVVDNQEDEYIPFNVHVLNDINMRFDLQGVGTCKKVTGKQNDADILNSIRQTGAHSYAADVISDPIPGIGCPLIVRAVANKDIYTDIMCYFTKTSYSGTFTLIFYNEADETIIPIFQSVAFGLGISEEESYKYPLYTAGGTSGLLPAWYSFSYTIPGLPPRTVTLHIYGNKFNCNMTKGAMLDSLLYPTATERCNISNFRLLQPSGEWKSAINYRQYFYANVKDTIGSYIYKNDSDDIEDYLVYPTTSDTNLVDRFTLVQPVNVIKKHLTDENESGFTLSLNGVKCKPDRLRSVLQGLDGHEYLVIPNGWFDRTLGVPLRPMQSTETLIDVITELLNKMPKQSYVLCIDLG